MFKALILIWAVSASEPVIIEDKLGPYETVNQCFHRGAVIIRSVFDTIHTAVAKAETLCLQNKTKEPEKEEGLAL
tara:strand:+ start:1511 stop:1735 length:225 start_codon:yes stop_codon:yes gene_type:complete